MRLTKSKIDKAEYRGNGKSRCVLWDDAVSGFGVRVFPSGRKSFVLFYRTGTRQRLMTLGQYGVLTLPQARALAQRTLARVKLEADDPLAEREAEKRAQTVAELADRYIEDHAKPRKKPSSVQGDLQMLRDHVLPTLGHRKIVDITRAEVSSLHLGLKETPYQANRMVALLSKMFNLAERWGLRPDGKNPCRHVERFKEKARERYLSGEELARLMETLEAVEKDGSESPHVVGAIRLLLFTGCRLREILELRWEYLDLDRGLARLPDSKTGAKTVFLNAPSRTILTSLPRTVDHPWVIEGKIAKSHLTDLQRPWRRIRALAGLEDVRLHDLRHTFASFGAGSGLSLPMIGKLLGHSLPSTTQRYAHLAIDPMQEAADRIGEAIEAALGQPSGG